jgi:hypothetical protein
VTIAEQIEMVDSAKASESAVTSDSIHGDGDGGALQRRSDEASQGDTLNQVPSGTEAA